MRIELQVDSQEFWPRLREDILAAQESVRIQTLSFEGDSAGKGLADVLRTIQPLDARVLVDAWTQFFLNDRFLYAPLNLLDRTLRREHVETRAMIRELKRVGVDVSFTNPVGPMMVNLPNRNHKKVCLVDDQVAYIGGINFSEHNFEWHDMMLRIEDPDLAAFLREDFDRTSRGENRSVSGSFGDIEILITDGKTNARQCEKIFDLIRGAKDHIVVHMPYTTIPFLEVLEEARKRGVRVTILAPLENNYLLVGGSLRWRCSRAGMDLRLYRGRMTHLKAMLVDDEVLVVGSGNFDFFTYRHHQDILAVIRDADLISKFRERVLMPDLEACEAYDGIQGTKRGRIEDALLRSVHSALGLLGS